VGKWGTDGIRGDCPGPTWGQNTGGEKGSDLAHLKGSLLS